jgi:hypothetical protein
MPATNYATIRKAAGWSRDRAAVEARVAYATCRLFEANPEAVAPETRARLEATWERMRVEAERRKSA